MIRNEAKHRRLPGNANMRKLLGYGLLVMCCGATRADAQDFRKVIQVVGELEDSVKVMIAREGTQRNANVADLRKEVADLRATIEKLKSSQAAIVKEPVAPPAATKPVLPAPVTSELFPNVKVGILAQLQAFGAQEATTALQDADPAYQSHWQRQLYVRRLRVLVGGNLSKATSIFFDSDAPNIGKVAANGAKSSTVSMYVQDAYVQHMFLPELGLVAGLQLVGFARNGLQSAASLMALNYGTYQFLLSGPLDNSVGRDVGFSARGFLADERLEYRVGVYSGKSLNLYSSLRSVVRVNYNFLDREKGYFYTGSTLGKGQIVALGAGIDLQSTYRGYGVDGFVDMPLFDAGSVTASISVSHLDGGGSDADSTFFTGQIPRQNILFAEAGYYFKDLGLQPYLKYEAQSVRAEVLKQVGATSPESLDLQNHLRSGSRYGFGLNYFLNGHGMSFKLLYERVLRNRLTLDKKNWEGASAGELTFQIQYFAF